MLLSVPEVSSLNAAADDDDELDDEITCRREQSGDLDLDRAGDRE